MPTGILHQGWLRTIGFLTNTMLEVGRQYEALKSLKQKPMSKYYQKHFLGNRNFQHTEHVEGACNILTHLGNLPILMLTTLDRHHCSHYEAVARKARLRIGSPGQG